MAQRKGILKGYRVKSDGEEVLTLHYANDTIVFLDVDIDMVETLRVLLTWFDASSGLGVNVAKTKIYQINSTRNWEDILHKWSCSEGSLPDTYFGLPLAASYKKNRFGRDLIEAFRDRLAQ